MKFSTILSLFLAACLTGGAVAVLAQDTPPAKETTVDPDAAETDLQWGDYTVKAYTLSFWGGSSSGATYLELPELYFRTLLTPGASDVVGYDGEVLPESRQWPKYDAPVKEIKAGDAFGGRIGIYIADDFHLDMLASYAKGEAVTSMIYTEDPDGAPNKSERVVVDSDPGFKVYKGGLALMYNATPATIFGIVPRLGFGLGGIINRFSVLEDKTALYLEGSLGMHYEVVNNLELGLQVDLTNFAFQVDELGYANMTNYTTYSVGLTWFIDRVPAPVRAAHMAEEKK